MTDAALNSNSQNQLSALELLYRLYREHPHNKEVKVHLLCELLRLGYDNEFEQVLGFGDQRQTLHMLWDIVGGMQRISAGRTNPLDDLAIKYGTDKSPEFHNFARYYFQFFMPLRMRAKRVLEIGIDRGASLQMWAEFFPNAVIYGIDNDPNSYKEQSEKIKTFIGSQDDRVFLKSFLDSVGTGFDIIIDDGGHRMREQVLTLQAFLPAVNPGGFYVIEDLHTSYWDFCGGGYKRQGTAIELLKDAIDEMNLFGKVDCGDPDRAIKALKQKNPALQLRYLEKHLQALYFFKSIAFLQMK